MTRRFSIWELGGAGAAIGGTGVWAFALAARVGLMRDLLEVFPRATWHIVTWVLIPALLLVPAVLQGVGVAVASDVRPAPVRRAVGGAVGGTLLAAMVLASMFVITRVPVQMIVGFFPFLPEFVVILFGIVLVAGWLLIAGRVSALGWLRLMALPLALAAVIIAWTGAHEEAAAALEVLDQREITGLFVAVAVGGTWGSVWNVVRPHWLRPLWTEVRLRLRDLRPRMVRGEPR